jgi:hypothetical protein
MLHAYPLDVYGPGLVELLAAGLAVLLGLYLAVSLLETGVLLLLRWDGFKRCLQASLLMNLVSTLAGFALLWFLLPLGETGLWISMLLSVLIEAGVLALFRRSAWRANLTAAAAANLASYLVLVLPVYLFGSA